MRVDWQQKQVVSGGDGVSVGSTAHRWRLGPAAGVSWVELVDQYWVSGKGVTSRLEVGQCGCVCWQHGSPMMTRSAAGGVCELMLIWMLSLVTSRSLLMYHYRHHCLHATMTSTTTANNDNSTSSPAECSHTAHIIYSGIQITQRSSSPIWGFSPHGRHVAPLAVKFGTQQ